MLTIFYPKFAEEVYFIKVNRISSINENQRKEQRIL